MGLLGIIRRWHLRDQVSLREIAMRLCISRNTVRRYLRSDVIEPVYRDRRTSSALDQYAFKLSSWLKTEANKSRKQRRSLKQIHADLCSLGFEGSYDRVAAIVVSAEIAPLEIPSKIDTWVYIAAPINAKPKNKKARIYAGFRGLSASVS